MLDFVSSSSDTPGVLSLASVIPIGKSILENYPESPLGEFDWCGAFEFVVDASIFDCRASDAWSNDIVFGIPSS